MICNRPKTMRTCWVIGVLLGSMFLSSCATIQNVIQTLQPELELKGVHFTGITFDALDLAVDVKVHNPNPLSIELVGFDYDLKINDTSFLKGQQDKVSKIAARGDSDLQIPVTVNFKNLYETFKTLKQQDSTAYQIGCGVSFDLPGLGKTRVPLKAEGELPMVKLPDIEVRHLKIKKLSFSGAKLELELRLKNSNPFALLLNSIDYELVINGKSWATGVGENVTQVTPKGETVFNLPIALDFDQIGSSVSQILSGKELLNYQLRAKLGVGSALPLLNNLTIPLDRSGTLNILR